MGLFDQVKDLEGKLHKENNPETPKPKKQPVAQSTGKKPEQQKEAPKKKSKGMPFWPF